MEDLSLHILDIAENSITAGATLIRIRLLDRRNENSFIIEIEDNGKGMTEDLVQKALDPFFTSRTTRSVGLGLSLLAQSAGETGGDITIKSTAGTGTKVIAQFKPAHIDMKPLGDIAETLMVLIAGKPEIDFTFDYDYDKNEEPLSFDTREVRADLENIPINMPEVLSSLKHKLSAALNDIKSRVM